MSYTTVLRFMKNSPSVTGERSMQTHSDCHVFPRSFLMTVFCEYIRETDFCVQTEVNAD